MNILLKEYLFIYAYQRLPKWDQDRRLLYKILFSLNEIVELTSGNEGKKF